MNTSGFDQVARRLGRFSGWLQSVPQPIKEQTFDIHLGRDQPVCLCGREGVLFLRKDGSVTRALADDLPHTDGETLHAVLSTMCDHSVFSHEQELKHGYVCTPDGYRIGVCGTAVVEDGQVKSMRDVTSLVFRIPRRSPGCGDRLFLEGIDFSRGVLIVGAPSSGKTTLLRDVAISLSTGRFLQGGRVTVLDERGELSGAFDLGPCTDILRGCPKAEAFEIAIRMLAPEFILCDELSPGDLPAVQQSVFSGVGVIASLHGHGARNQRPLLRKLLVTNSFQTVVYLGTRENPGEIDRIERMENSGYGEDSGCGFSGGLRIRRWHPADAPPAQQNAVFTGIAAHDARV